MFESLTGGDSLGRISIQHFFNKILYLTHELFLKSCVIKLKIYFLVYYFLDGGIFVITLEEYPLGHQLVKNDP